MAKLVAVTACPTGIAHTIMAAEGLEQAAKALGHDIHVETQGSVGTRNTLSEADIAAAEEEDGNFVERRVRLKLPTDFAAAHAGEIDVEEDQVGRMIAGGQQNGAALVRRAGGIAVGAQGFGKGFMILPGVFREKKVWDFSIRVLLDGHLIRSADA